LEIRVTIRKTLLLRVPQLHLIMLIQQTIFLTEIHLKIMNQIQIQKIQETQMIHKKTWMSQR
jgi:hypothetical protein